MFPLLLACTSGTVPAPTAGGGPTASPPTGGTTFPGTTPLTSATTGGGEPFDVEVEVTAVPTVLRVRWSTAVPTRGRVRFQLEDGPAWTTPWTPEDTVHEALVVGVPGDREVELRIEDGTTTWDPFTARTDPLPDDVPTWTATGEPAWPGFWATTVTQRGRNWFEVLDAEARVVWFAETAADLTPVRGWFDVARQRVIVCNADTRDYVDSELLFLALDGTVLEERPAPWWDHDFAVLSDGTLVGIAVSPYAGKDPALQGTEADDLQEIAPDGTVTTTWSAWWELAAYAIPNRHFTHANAIDVEPPEDRYHLGLKDMGTLLEIDRASGAILWAMGGAPDEFTWTDGTGAPPTFHQFQFLDGDRILFFQNGSAPDSARLVEVGYDLASRTAWTAWSYTPDPPIHVATKGDVLRLDDGTTRVAWSTDGRVQDIDPAGAVAWEAALPSGASLGFFQHLERLDP